MRSSKSQSLSQHLKNARISCGLTQSELAIKMQVSKSKLSRAENMKTLISHSLVIDYAKHTGESVEFLLLEYFNYTLSIAEVKGKRACILNAFELKKLNLRSNDL